MNNSVVVNGGLQEKNSRTDDVKNLLSNALSLLDSGIDTAVDKSKNIYGDINGEKMFNFTKSIKLFGMDFALNYDKSKSVEENIAHYSGNFLATAVVGSAVAFAGAGIVSSAFAAMGIVEGLKALGFELGDYTEIAYKIAKEYANEIMNDEEVKLFSPTKDYKQKLYTDFTAILKYFNEDGSVNFAKYLADMLNISLYDPIALDLDANGKIDTLSLENGVFFDHNGDDIAFKSSWISGVDGILVRDIDGDGKITSGAELFGNKSKSNNHYSYTNPNAKDDFEALKEPDSNNDGIISNLDENFDKLQIWQDSNSKGVSETNELKSLSELGIESLNLNKFTNLNLLVA